MGREARSEERRLRLWSLLVRLPETRDGAATGCGGDHGESGTRELRGVNQLVIELASGRREKGPI